MLCLCYQRVVNIWRQGWHLDELDECGDGPYPATPLLSLPRVTQQQALHVQGFQTELYLEVMPMRSSLEEWLPSYEIPGASSLYLFPVGCHGLLI